MQSRNKISLWRSLRKERSFMWHPRRPGSDIDRADNVPARSEPLAIAFGVRAIYRRYLSCARSLALSCLTRQILAVGWRKRFPLRDMSRSKIIIHTHAVDLERIDRLDLRRRSHPFEPCSRTPAILVGHRYQVVFHRVLMHVVQPRQITVLVRQFRIPKVEPYLASLHAVQTVEVV